MHIRKFLSAVILGTCFMVSANAAIKCVNLKSSMTCNGISTEGRVDWSTHCDGINIKGAGICSDRSGYVGNPVDSISTGYGAHKYCWCKMTSPAVSRFVYSNDFASPDACYKNCGPYCAGFLRDNATYRATMFSNLTD